MTETCRPSLTVIVHVRSICEKTSRRHCWQGNLPSRMHHHDCSQGRDGRCYSKICRTRYWIHGDFSPSPVPCKCNLADTYFISLLRPYRVPTEGSHTPCYPKGN